MTTEEIWKPAIGHEGAYAVSNHGRVRSLPHRRPVKLRGGASTTRAVKGTLLRSGTDSAGYQSVCVGGRSVRVHILVLEAFIGPRMEGLQGLHNNGDKNDNRLCNLRYGTRADNMNDMVHHGQRKLTVEQVHRIRAATGERGFKKRLAAELGVSISTIQDVRKGRSYRHV